LANKKSALKRMRQNEKRRLHNRHFRARARTDVKTARLAIESGGVDLGGRRIIKKIKALDKAASKGKIHKNNASRRISRLMKQLSSMEQSES
jgi:small subunit ribosomal protein S20